MDRSSVRPRPQRHGAGAASIVVTLVALLAGCAGGAPSTSSGSTSEIADPASTPTPTPTPTPVDIREIDLGTRNVMYSSGGFSAPVWISLDGGTGTDGTVTYSMAAPVYSDANGDGVDDALVAIERLEGSAWESLWYVFLADEIGEVSQVAVPVARSASCGDLVESTAPAPDGGFAVEVLTRIRLKDDSVPCSDPGTGRESRVIAVDGAAGDPLALPVQTAPATAWGGICPGTTWWDTESSTVELLALPVASSPVANAATASAGIFPAAQNPAPLLSSMGIATDGWAFVVFIGEVYAAQNDKPLTCAWGQAA